MNPDGPIADVATADPPQLEELIRALEGELVEDYVPPHIKRQAHPKMHGCVLARFTVRPDVPDDLRYGLFRHVGREFQAWVRLSNAFGIEHDLKFENRGFAIKVLDVQGPHLRIPGGELFSAEDDTQDFILSTHDAFPLVDAVGYAEFSAAARKGTLLKVFISSRNWRGLIALVRGGLVEARNLLAITYNSQTAYRLGPHIVKVRARPKDMTKELTGTFLGRWIFRGKVLAVNFILNVTKKRTGFVHNLARLVGFSGTPEAAELFCHRYVESRHYLRTTLEQSLATGDATFDIGIQKQTNEKSMPSDDPRVRWREWRAQFRNVATLTIPRQVFWPAAGMPPVTLRATEDMVENGENMSFNPWHGLVEHEPLGRINRARGEIYAGISKYRHHENHTPLPRPEAEYVRLRDRVLYGSLR